jgi:hypothetical protein
MFCSNCGTQLPDEANFCWKCGRPQNQGSTVEEPRWEMCEIDWVAVDSFLDAIRGRCTGHLEAKAIGPKGIYIAGKTQEFSVSGYVPSPYDKKAKQMFDGLVAQLVNIGWEPAETTSNAWYGNRFRRRIRT